MSTSKVRRVYHFLNAEYGIQSIERKRIKISTVLGVNDPFELLGYDVSNRALRDLLMESRQMFNKEFGLLCFSKSSYSPVQWAHYGARHTGLCLGFDVNAELLEDVIYQDVRVSDYVLPIDEASQLEWVRSLLFTKCSQWAYEEEVRSFSTLATEEDGLFFKVFDEDFSLAEIQVGFNCNLSRADISRALVGEAKDVSIFKVRPAFKSFQMVRNLDDRLWK